MWKRRTSVLLGALLMLSSGCGARHERPADGRLHVFVGIPPLAYLVEQIGGDRVEVGVLVQPGQDPHTFQPKPQQVVALGRAAIFFKSDMPFETTLLEKIRGGNRGLEIVETARGIKKRPLGCRDHAEDHGAASARADNLDPHVWLSPSLAKTLAENVAEALCRADPEHRQEYQKNLAALNARLDQLDRRIRRMLAPYRGRSFYVFHPGFGYFADAYGLHEEAIEIEGQSPTARQLRAMLERAKADGVKTVFVQPEFDPRLAQIVAEELGGRAVPLNGLGKDLVADIEDVAKKIEEAMREK